MDLFSVLIKHKVKYFAGMQYAVLQFLYGLVDYLFFPQWHLVQDVKVDSSLEADTNTEILSGILGIFSDKHFKKQILIEICHLEISSPLLRI